MINRMYAALPLLSKIGWLLVIPLVVVLLAQAELMALVLTFMVLVVATVGLTLGSVIEELEWWL